jgi:hypothetical protein
MSMQELVLHYDPLMFVVGKVKQDKGPAQGRPFMISDLSA